MQQYKYDKHYIKRRTLSFQTNGEQKLQNKDIVYCKYVPKLSTDPGTEHAVDNGIGSRVQWRQTLYE